MVFGKTLFFLGAGLVLNMGIANSQDIKVLNTQEKIREHVFAVLVEGACIRTEYSDKCKKYNIINFYDRSDGILDGLYDHKAVIMPDSNFICRESGNDRVNIPKDKSKELPGTDDFSIIPKDSKYNNVRNWKKCK